MPCIGCQRKNKNMESKIKELAKSGFDANRIAAMLMIHKHKVEEVLSDKTTVSTQEIVEEPIVEKPKRKKKKSIEDETI